MLPVMVWLSQVVSCTPKCAVPARHGWRDPSLVHCWLSMPAPRDNHVSQITAAAACIYHPNMCCLCMAWSVEPGTDVLVTCGAGSTKDHAMHSVAAPAAGCISRLGVCCLCLTLPVEPGIEAYDLWCRQHERAVPGDVQLHLRLCARVKWVCTLSLPAMVSGTRH